MSTEFSESVLATLDLFKLRGALWCFGGFRAMSFNAMLCLYMNMESSISRSTLVIP